MRTLCSLTLMLVMPFATASDLSQKMDDAKNLAGQVKSQAQESGAEAVAQAQEKAQDVTDAAKDMQDQAESKADTAIADAQDKVETTKDAVIATATEATNEVSSAAADQAAQGQKQVANVQEKAEQAKTKGRTQVEESIEVGDARVSKIFHSQGHNMMLNGAGTRTKFFMDMYVAALYLKSPTKDAQAVVDADEPMAIRLYIVSSMINSERMSDATRDGFVRSTQGNTAPIEDEIDDMIEAFADAVEDGDVFDLVYLPEEGVTVYRNGVEKTNVEGLEFKQALFGIWLSEDPVQDSVKDDMMND